MKIGSFSLNTSWLKIIIKLLLILLAISLLIHFGAFNRALLFSIHLDLSRAMVSIVIVTLIVFLLSWRWLIILTGANIISNYWKLCRIVFIGFFYNMILPGNLGCDFAMICYASAEHDGERTLAGGSVILDRFFGIITLLVISIFSILYILMLRESPLFLKRMFLIIIGFLLIGLSVLTLVGFALKYQRLASLSIRGFYLRDLLRLWPKRRKLVMIIALSLLIYGLIIFNMINCAYILGYQDINIPIWLAVIPTAILVNQIPITPGGLGLGEFSLFALLSLLNAGQNANPGALVFFLFRLTFYLLAIPGAIIMLWEPLKEKNISA